MVLYTAALGWLDRLLLCILKMDSRDGTSGA